MYSFALISIFLLTIRAIVKSKKATESIKELFTNKRWVINFSMIIAFIIYIFYVTYNNNSSESERLKTAIKKAIVALLIAVFAELGLTIAPFWLVFVLAYYLEGWI
tara:strand:- start:159 stop:476 length:318 start_codon:yes stop_codon:yes gene_type:complete